MRRKEKYYYVEFSIYQYNSGCADNGTFKHKIKYESLNEAMEAKKKIDAAYGEKDSDKLSDDIREWVEELIYNNTAIGGFIYSRAKVFAKYVVEIEVAIKN